MKICRKYPELSPDNGGDLLQDAFLAVMEGRRLWQPANVSFVPFLIGVMRSLAHSHHKHLMGSHSPDITFEHQLPATGDGTSAIDSFAAASQASPEDTVSEQQEHAFVEAGIAILRAQLKEQPVSLAILDGLLDGKEKKEIRESLGIADKVFWSADRRLTRTIENYLRSI
ncbi:sigma factor [Paraburkholderia sp. A3BS-1L]|uniref:RNA polymerase sigma factor n=1 Tax=Paraburkholderia sp. A3BS-1L TaxID=3028375 RepID=UPI003DA99D9B